MADTQFDCETVTAYHIDHAAVTLSLECFFQETSLIPLSIRCTLGLQHSTDIETLITCFVSDANIRASITYYEYYYRNTLACVCFWYSLMFLDQVCMLSR